MRVITETSGQRIDFQWLKLVIQWSPSGYGIPPRRHEIEMSSIFGIMRNYPLCNAQNYKYPN